MSYGRHPHKCMGCQHTGVYDYPAWCPYCPRVRMALSVTWTHVLNAKNVKEGQLGLFPLEESAYAS